MANIEKLSATQVAAKIRERSSETLKKVIAKGTNLQFNPKAILDIAFLFDTTGSMYSYLEEVRRQLSTIVSEIFSSIPNVQMGIIAYGDYCDANSTYVTKVLDLTADFNKVKLFITSVEKTGGGDAPEAVEEALFQANNLHWRVASKRAIVLVGDAPPHGVIDSSTNCLYGHDYKAETKNLIQKNVTLYATQCGRDSSAEQVFRWMAAQTQGVYLNLENISDLIDLLIGACMKEVGLLQAYVDKLRSRDQLTDSKQQILKQLGTGNKK